MNIIMENNIFKSISDTDRAPVVICNTEHTVIYMNKAAIDRYKKYGGEELLGKTLLSCHSKKSSEIIEKILTWFKESEKNNMIYTYKNTEENKDVYMVALRDPGGKLIGYYEKHEYRDREKAKIYDFDNSLV